MLVEAFTFIHFQRALWNDHAANAEHLAWFRSDLPFALAFDVALEYVRADDQIVEIIHVRDTQIQINERRPTGTSTYHRNRIL